MNPQFHVGDKVNVIINRERTVGKIIAYPNGEVTIHSSDLRHNRIWNYSGRYRYPDETTDIFTNNGQLYAILLEDHIYYLVELASNHIVRFRQGDLFEFQNILTGVVDGEMNAISEKRLPGELNDNIESYLWHTYPRFTFDNNVGGRRRKTRKTRKTRKMRKTRKTRKYGNKKMKEIQDTKSQKNK